MDRREIENYVQRDWDAAGASHLGYWAERFRTVGWRAGWDAAQALLTHIRSVQRDFPTDADRHRDFAHHEALRAILDRASHAFSGR